MYNKIGRRILASCMVMLLVVACAGKTPHPIDVYQPDDNSLSCNQIWQEINQNQAEVGRLYPQTNKTGKNVALGVAGAFFIVPLFFMDFSDAERVEIEAYQRRDMHLHNLGQNKGCMKLPARMKLQFSKKKK